MNKIIAAFLTVSIIVISGCKTNDAGDPKEVLLKFFDAISKKDIEEAKKYTTKDSEGMMGMVQMGMQSMGDKQNDMLNYEKGNVDIGTATIDGDKAIVPVKKSVCLKFQSQYFSAKRVEVKIIRRHKFFVSECR